MSFYAFSFNMCSACSIFHPFVVFLDSTSISLFFHATFSADDEHSGSDVMLNVLDKAFAQSHRLPDAVFSGHVHNYQRFTRELNGREIPYLVVGNGGHKLHKMQKNDNGIIKTPFKLPDRDDVTLESYCDDRYGFMRLEITTDKLQGKFFSAGARH